MSFLMTKYSNGMPDSSELNVSSPVSICAVGTSKPLPFAVEAERPVWPPNRRRGALAAPGSTGLPHRRIMLGRYEFSRYEQVTSDPVIEMFAVGV